MNENEVVNEVTVVNTESSEGRCGFRMDAKSGLIGAGIALAGLGLFKAGKAIKRKFRKDEVEKEIFELENEEGDPDTKEEEETKTK